MTTKRSVLLSVMTIMLCLAIIAAGTYALFSEQVKLTHHLKAGSLNITLTRTNLVTESLDTETGFIVESENPKDIDFSKPVDESDPSAENRNVFDMADGAFIVPGCRYSAEMQISNSSDVAFGYWLEIVFDDKIDKTLAEQLKITVKTVDGETSGILSTSAGRIGKEDAPIGILAKGGAETFTVSLEFCDLDQSVNNNAQGKSFKFDVVIFAVQSVTAPAS